MFVRSLNYFAIVLLTNDLRIHVCITNKNYSAWYIHLFLEFNFNPCLFCLFVCLLFCKINYTMLMILECVVCCTFYKTSLLFVGLRTFLYYNSFKFWLSKRKNEVTVVFMVRCLQKIEGSFMRIIQHMRRRLGQVNFRKDLRDMLPGTGEKMASTCGRRARLQ